MRRTCLIHITICNVLFACFLCASIGCRNSQRHSDAPPTKKVAKEPLKESNEVADETSKDGLVQHENTEPSTSGGSVVTRQWNENNPDLTADLVEKYQVGEDTIHVLFSGHPGQRKGWVRLIGPQGPISIFHGWDSLSDTDNFLDVTGDGVPEIIGVANMSGKRAKNPERVLTEMTNIVIIPVSVDQKPLLSLLFDHRPAGSRRNWSWQHAIDENGKHTISIWKPNQAKAEATFIWSSDLLAFQGPRQESGEDGFIAEFGKFELKTINDFIHLRD